MPWLPVFHEPALPGFDAFKRQSRFLDVFNRGKLPFEFTAAASAPWIHITPAHSTVVKDQRLWVTIGWDQAPSGSSDGSVKISGPDGRIVVVGFTVFNPAEPARATLHGFVEGDGYVSIEAEHFTRKLDADLVRWGAIPDYGRTLSSVAIYPVTAKSVAPSANSPCLEYQMYLFHPGKVEVETILAPTLNFVPGRGLRFAISFDDQPPQIIDALAHNTIKDWGQAVEDSVRKVQSIHTLETPGYHTLKFWMVDPGVVLQKLVVDLGGVKPSYLGPPESYRNPQ